MLHKFKRKIIKKRNNLDLQIHSCVLNRLESQVELLKSTQQSIEELEHKIHNIQTKFYPMIAYFICAFANAVDSSLLCFVQKCNNTSLDRGAIEQIMEILCVYLKSEELRNKVEGVETFDVEQFLVEFKELCDYKSKEALYREQLSALREHETEIKKFLGIK